VKALPPDSAVKRAAAGAANSFPPVEELLAVLVERIDAWGDSHLDALMGRTKVSIPPPIRIQRPGQQGNTRRVETDPRRIAEFFGGASPHQTG
jgi:hypothetical protein